MLLRVDFYLLSLGRDRTTAGNIRSLKNHLRLGAGEDAHELDIDHHPGHLRTFYWQSSKLLVGFWEAILLVPIFVPGSLSSSRSRELVCCSRTTSAKS